MYYNKNTIIYLNGEFIKASESSADLYSQTLHYGYGVFEGIRAYPTPNGTKIFKAKEHFERLQRSACLLHIPLEQSIEKLTEASYQLLRANKLQNAYLRPVVFLDANMGLANLSKANIAIMAWEWEPLLGNKMLRIYTSPYQRPNPKSIHIEAKANGHYVNSILASLDAKSKGFDEALLLDNNGFVAEASTANLFMEKEGKLYTPKLGNILPGITRATVIEIAQQLGITCQEKDFTVQELKQADSAFLCGTAAEIVGICSLDNYTFPMPWKKTLGYRIQSLYSKLVREEHLAIEQTIAYE